MDAAKLQTIHIPENRRRRSQGSFWVIVVIIGGITAAAMYFANPWQKDSRDEVAVAKEPAAKNESPATQQGQTAQAPKPTPSPQAKPGDVVLTTSGYIINRERIERSAEIMGRVEWIGVKKGDAVKKGQVIVRLDDTEQRAKIEELDGQIAVASVELERAKLNFDRIKKLRLSQNESVEREDEARLSVAVAEAQIKRLKGARSGAQVWLDRTVITSNIDGVVLDKLADPGELVSSQSFGGTGGPKTSLVALGDPKDLQVEIDISERDIGKIALNQRCRVSPEAYPEKVYGGHVAEIAPEANRQKGTLQIKVQIENPDHFLTPEGAAKVETSKQ